MKFLCIIIDISDMISILSTIATCILGFIAIWQTKKYQRMTNDSKEQDLIIQTTPHISFKGLEFGKIEDQEITFSSDSKPYITNSDVFINPQDDYKTQACFSLIFRFSCDSKNYLHNFIVNRLIIMTRFLENPQDNKNHYYEFYNDNAEIGNSSIDLVENHDYAACKWICFDTYHSKEFNESERTTRNKLEMNEMVSDLLAEGQYARIIIFYSAANVFGVISDGILTFGCIAEKCKDGKIILGKPIYLCDFVNIPYVIQKVLPKSKKAKKQNDGDNY